METMLESLEATMPKIVKDLQTFRAGGEYQFAKLCSRCSHFELALPSFLTELKERDTGQYTNITTIATFFSSVTATTLQISFSTSTPVSKLLAVINLLWFLSLIFSVSAGVSSLLGLMWRKSPMHVFLLSTLRLTLLILVCRYYTNATPKLFQLWLEKAPVIFLIIAALVFIVGLNLLAFFPTQVCSSFNIFLPICLTLYQRRFEAITTVAFTGVHIIGLLMLIVWFFLESQQQYIVAKWLRHPLQQYHRNLELQRDIWWYSHFLQYPAS